MVASCATRAQEAKVSLGAEEAVGSDSRSNDEDCKHSGFHDVSEAEELRAPGVGDIHDVRDAHFAHGDDDGAGGDRDVRGAGAVHVCARDVRGGAAPGDHDNDDGGHGDHFEDVRGAHFGGDHGAHDVHDVDDDEVHDFGGVHGAGGAGCHGVDDDGAFRGATLSYRSDGVGLGVATDRSVLPVGVVGPGSGGRMPGTIRRNAAASLSPVRGFARQDRHDPIGLRVAGRSHVPHRGYPRAKIRF